MQEALNQPKSGILNGNALKLIAAVTMLCDHAGLMFFPKLHIMRIIGRLAFPIFAFMIAEGCHYTKNRLRYFLSVFLMGVLCQTVYYIFSRDTYLNILLTFSCSIGLIYLLQEWKARQDYRILLLFAVATVLIYGLNRLIDLDYGFWGIMVPVAAAFCHPPRGEKIDSFQNYINIGMLGVALIMLAVRSSSTQSYSLLALPLLLLYSGKRGKRGLKYAFYLFYPLHLAALQAIAWLLAKS